MKNSINIALIGCGRIASRHVHSIQQIPNTRLVAFVDTIETRALRFSKEYGADAYTDFCQVLEREDVDMVDICTPSGMHAQMSIGALQAGKHVLVEKPMALSLEDADRMIEASKSNKKKLCVVLQNRFNPPMQDLRKVVDQGKLGRLLLGNVTVRWYRPQEYYEDGWHGTLNMDGGALMNQSIHHIDALQWLMGPVERVYAYTDTLAHHMEAEDTGVAVLRFKNGALGVIEGSTITYPENIEGSIALFGERGSVKVGGTALNRKVLWKIAGELEHERELLTQDEVDPPSVYGYSHKTVIADFTSAILNGCESKTPGEEARKSVALVLAIYESARTGREVQMTNGIWNGQS